MKIKNLTSKLKEIVVAELVGGRSYKIYLEPFSETELEGLLPVNVNDPEISIESATHFEEKSEEIITESTQETEEVAIDEPEEDQIEDSKQEVIPGKFICDECGAEYASARSLATHKTKSHK